MFLKLVRVWGPWNFRVEVGSEFKIYIELSNACQDSVFSYIFSRTISAHLFRPQMQFLNCALSLPRQLTPGCWPT